MYSQDLAFRWNNLITVLRAAKRDAQVAAGRPNLTGAEKDKYGYAARSLAQAEVLWQEVGATMTNPQERFTALLSLLHSEVSTGFIPVKHNAVVATFELVRSARFDGVELQAIRRQPALV